MALKGFLSFIYVKSHEVLGELEVLIFVVFHTFEYGVAFLIDWLTPNVIDPQSSLLFNPQLTGEENSWIHVFCFFFRGYLRSEHNRVDRI